ncbi:MAG: hypothetical protein IIC12_07590 [Proteobacteria bacterium]|nr:hypothetical protein [Pseudomonadota bacterium]
MIRLFSDTDITLSGEELSYYIIDEMNAMVYDLDDYRDQQGVFPGELEQLGMPDDRAWSYRRLDEDRYRISFRAGGQTLTYSSDESADDFFAEVRGIE